jgi:hypothetical protein
MICGLLKEGFAYVHMTSLSIIPFEGEIIMPPFKQRVIQELVKADIHIRDYRRKTVQDALILKKMEELMIDEHWAKLNGAPGNAISVLERAGTGYRKRYEHGTIYAREAGNVVGHVYGSISDRYNELGGPSSWLGFPIHDSEEPFSDDGGRVSVFENGEIYWWPDVGAVELNEVTVHYTGIYCFGETDESSDSDEPYVVMGVVSPVSNSVARTQIYDDVDAGESVPDFFEVYRGKPYGVNISILFMEHDVGNPDQYKSHMTAAVGAAATGITAALAVIPVVGVAIAAVAGPALAAAVPAVAEELYGLLNFDDDRIGQTTVTLTPKQLVVLAARTNNTWFKGIGYKFESQLISDGEASYKVYFGLVPS